MKRIQKHFICLLALILILFALSPLPASIYAAGDRSIEFATDPTFGSEYGTYSVDLKITPNIPAPDAGFIDPSKVMLGVYRIPKQETFEPTQRTKFSKIFEQQYNGDGTATTFTLQDYVTKNALPKPGDTIVAYLDVYAFDMMTYQETIKESTFSKPFVIPGDEEQPIQPTKPEIGTLTVKFQTEAGTPLQGGDFKIIQLTGTGTKNTLDKMPYGKYIVRLDLVPEGYIPLEPHQHTVDINDNQKDVEVIFTFKSEAAAHEGGSIPYVNLTPILSPDHPSVFIRIEDMNVHPVNGLTVTIIDPNQNRHPVIDAKLNSSDETPYKILALPIKLFEDMGTGAFQIELKQPGYETTLVPLTLAERTALPVVNESDDGYVYVSDQMMTVKTEPNASLDVTFLIDPRSEENILSVDASHIKETSSGVYTVDFSALADQLSDHKIVKVVAQKVGKSPSEIVEVSLKQNRPDTSDHMPDQPAPGGTEQPDQPTPGGAEQPDQPAPGVVEKPTQPSITNPINNNSDLVPGKDPQPSSDVTNKQPTQRTTAPAKVNRLLPRTGETSHPEILIIVSILLVLSSIYLIRLRSER